MVRRKVVFLLGILTVAVEQVVGFSASSPAPPTPAFGGFLDSLFGSDPIRKEREELKASLVEECQQSKPSRERIEEIIADLQERSPTPNSAASARLQKKWILVWTTEKEINFFRDFGISGTISQTIKGPDLENCIPFKRGGSFSVSGRLNIPDPNGIRTEFEFESAILDVGKWGTYELPPVGAGWFDTLYLDDDFRVDINSRDDILICTTEQD